VTKTKTFRKKVKRKEIKARNRKQRAHYRLILSQMLVFTYTYMISELSFCSH